MTQGCSVPNPSQSAQILKWLKSGKRLTALEALSRFGCSRLAARIDDLRKDGHAISARRIKVKTYQGSDAWVSEYRISDTGATL